jgi:hypothetical protein
MDQASGLRLRVSERSEGRGYRTEGAHLPPVPLVVAHLRLSGSSTPTVPPGSLLWHWRLVQRAATGWDMQARLHVCGLPAQFCSAELSQWRLLCAEWHLIGGALESLLIADVVQLWLPPSSGQMPSLLPRLRRWLTWLCRMRSPIPIILTGTTAAVGHRLARWAKATGIIPPDYPLLQAEEGHTIALNRRKGFYRLLQQCRNRPLMYQNTHDRQIACTSYLEEWK